MLKKYFIFSKKDEFSNNIFNELKSELNPDEKKSTKDYQFFNLKSGQKENSFLLFDELHLYFDIPQTPILDEDAVYFIISKHKSKDGESYFTVHYTGNYLKAEYGGEDNTLSFCNPNLKGPFYNTQEIPVKFMVEATHHGPYFTRPHIFIECGPDEKSWEDKENIVKYIKWIKPLFLLEEIPQKKGGIIIGGTHYFDFEFIENLESKHNVSIGHIMPKYIISTLIENREEFKKRIEQMIEKTLNCEVIFIYKSYVARYGEIKQIVEEIKLASKSKELEIISI